MGQKTNLPYNF